jgi:hypothetical protein
LKLGFVPPFKACGQNDSIEGPDDQAFNTTFIDPYWYDQFALYFLAAIEGCQAPCTTAKVWFELVSIPEDEEINLALNNTIYNLDACNITDTVGEYDPATDWMIDGALPMDPALLTGWGGLLHFTSPGTYTLGFYAECPETTCFPGGIVGSKVQDFKVRQWKDAAKIVLREKWNLISLPLVPFETSVAALLAPVDLDLDGDEVSDLISIHSYDKCTDTWKVYGNGQTSLTTMVDGKSYWVRMVYPTDDLEWTWWVWGTAKAMPPAAPSAYTECAGWNMFGFTSLLPKDCFGVAPAYLWNFGSTPLSPTPLVYGWDAALDWTASGWNLIIPGEDLLVGQGYWGFFPAGGLIVP